jgi:hypothetical protein
MADDEASVFLTWPWLDKVATSYEAVWLKKLGLETRVAEVACNMCPGLPRRGHRGRSRRGTAGRRGGRPGRARCTPCRTRARTASPGGTARVHNKE